MARILFLLPAVFVAGCGGPFDPFGGVKELDRSKPPENATEYVCQGDHRFYLRLLDGNAAAWVILPERQFRLDRAAQGEYANHTTRLSLKQGEATLTDDSDLRLTGCKVPEKS